MEHSEETSAWTNNNDMKINSEKSKEMIISYAHGNIGNEVPNILIEGKVVERVDHVKLLGYYIVQRFDIKEACGQYCEESWKENIIICYIS